LPFIAVAAALIWLEDRHNPLYIAERIGTGGKPFKFIKLRSISRHAGVRPDEIITTRDSRVTALGHFIRTSKLDELPQFWHVLKGDMSLVGPRASVRAIVDAFTEEEMRILSARFWNTATIPRAIMTVWCGPGKVVWRSFMSIINRLA
jgi:lipopolysaccharide/colanic/teichoic acid biosynthesis glycosyltransferase